MRARIDGIYAPRWTMSLAAVQRRYYDCAPGEIFPTTSMREELVRMPLDPPRILVLEAKMAYEVSNPFPPLSFIIPA